MPNAEESERHEWLSKSIKQPSFNGAVSYFISIMQLLVKGSCMAANTMKKTRLQKSHNVLPTLP